MVLVVLLGGANSINGKLGFHQMGSDIVQTAFWLIVFFLVASLLAIKNIIQR